MAFSLNSVLVNMLAPEVDWRRRLIKEWTSMVGSLHVRMRLERVVHDTIIIGVYEVHWMQELYMVSDMIRSALNDKLGGEYIAKVRFVIADARSITTKKQPVVACHQSIVEKPLQNAQKALLKKIEDKKLQEALSQLWYRCQS